MNALKEVRDAPGVKEFTNERFGFQLDWARLWPVEVGPNRSRLRSETSPIGLGLEFLGQRYHS
jgi:hypothetical protein